MNLGQLKEAFNAGALAKPEYIRQMHAWHKLLFEYTKVMRESDICRIEIDDNEVVMTVRSSGMRMVCDPTDERIAPIEILNFGSYEPNEAVVIKQMLAADSQVFDIGANFGWYSLNLSKQIPGLTVHAFEPVRKTYDYLCRNIELNDVANVHAHHFGFAAKAESKTFYFYPEGSGNASLANLSERKDVEEITCEIRRLDDFVAEGEYQVDFIKCDVEGAELFVFQGGIETLKTQHPIVFTEMLRKWAFKFDYHPNQILSLFRELGYRCFTARNAKLVEFAAMDDHTEETNFFFLHAKKHAIKIEALSR